MERSPSAAALDAWCDAERGRAAGLAEALSVSATTINHYRRGVIAPVARDGDDKRAAIEKHTAGEVLASGWTSPPPASVPTASDFTVDSDAPRAA